MKILPQPTRHPVHLQILTTFKPPAAIQMYSPWEFQESRSRILEWHMVLTNTGGIYGGNLGRNRFGATAVQNTHQNSGCTVLPSKVKIRPTTKLCLKTMRIVCTPASDLLTNIQSKQTHDADGTYYGYKEQTGASMLRQIMSPGDFYWVIWPKWALLGQFFGFEHKFTEL